MYKTIGEKRSQEFEREKVAVQWCLWRKKRDG